MPLSSIATTASRWPASRLRRWSSRGSLRLVTAPWKRAMALWVDTRSGSLAKADRSEASSGRIVKPSGEAAIVFVHACRPTSARAEIHSVGVAAVTVEFHHPIDEILDGAALTLGACGLAIWPGPRAAGTWAKGVPTRLAWPWRGRHGWPSAR